MSKHAAERIAKRLGDVLAEEGDLQPTGAELIVGVAMPIVCMIDALDTHPDVPKLPIEVQMLRLAAQKCLDLFQGKLK